MKLNKTLTATVYVVNKNRVLLHMHKKYNSLFPLGGHILEIEVPHECALREVYEESGLQVELYIPKGKMELGSVIQLVEPMYILLENVGRPVENLDFIYFATTTQDTVTPQEGESGELYWLTKEEVIENEHIKPHIKSMSIKALETLGNP